MLLIASLRFNCSCIPDVWYYAISVTGNVNDIKHDQSGKYPLLAASVDVFKWYKNLVRAVL